jgi:hypothetical protein
MSNQSKSKSKKITDIPLKYMPPKPIGPDGKEIPFAENPQTIAYILRYAENARQREKDAKLEAKRQEEKRQAMEEYEKNRGRIENCSWSASANYQKHSLRFFLRASGSNAAAVIYL